MLGIIADDHDAAFPLNNLALFAHRLYRRSYFHDIYLLLFCTAGCRALAIYLLGAPGNAPLGEIVGGA